MNDHDAPVVPVWTLDDPLEETRAEGRSLPGRLTPLVVAGGWAVATIAREAKQRPALRWR
jgi:hypothetical protein